ncbi:MAG: hypothetical protein AAF959_25870 [Cyanobacteria bacterium P01_D01_bin.56]
MTGLTIWKQQALAGKREVPLEAGYTKIFYGFNNPEGIEQAHSRNTYFIYWNNKSLNGIFKSTYGLKFWIGRFSGQVLPSPLWELGWCKRHGLTNSADKKKSGSKGNSKIDNANSDVSFFKIIQWIGNLIWVALIVEFIQWLGKLLWAAVPVMLFDSFNHSLGNEKEANKEISTISQVLGISEINGNRYSPLNRHTLPRDGLTHNLSIVIGLVLFIAFGILSDRVFNPSDYLINQVRIAYGVTDFWSELWIEMNLPPGSPSGSNVIRVLFLSLIIWVVIRLLELFLYLLSIGISLKMVFLFRESRFSESACVLESLRILIELEREDALSSPLQRKYLMIRMTYLSSMSLLIPNTYLGNRYRKEWVNNQFRSISAFIQDRQSWLYAPGGNTLQDLRRDFHMLVQMYIDGTYGTFPHSEEFWPKAVPDRKQWLQAITQLIGFLIPLGLIVSVFIFPGSLPTSLQSPEIQGAFIWVGTAWLFLGIDRYLNFGVLDSIVDLASGLKGLK